METAAGKRELTFTGERIVPGQVPEGLFREHEARYQLAGEYVKGQCVLDVACGTGIGTHYLKRQGAVRAIGVDIDPDALLYATEAYPGCWWIRADATHLPLEQETVDVVVSFETIEHLLDPARFLQECYRVLRPSGRFICSTPHRRVYRRFGKNPYHCKEMDAEEFLNLLKNYFEIQEVFSQCEVLYPILVLRRLVINALDKIGSGDILRRLFKRKPEEFHGEEFSPPNESTQRLTAYTRQGWRQPIYVVAVCQKK